MTASFSTWRIETPIEPSGNLPIIYQTKITKTKVIPLYRLADSKGETQDVIVYMVDSFDKELKEYLKKETYPIPSLMPVIESKLSHEQIALDMIQNCLALGLKVEDGEKEEGWKGFVPKASLPPTIPMDDLTKYYDKVIEPILETSNVINTTISSNVVEIKKEIVYDGNVGYVKQGKETEEGQEIYILSERGRGMPKQFIMIENKFKGLKEIREELALTNTTTTGIPKHKGRVRVNPISEELENLFNLGHRVTKCCECGKDIGIQQAFVEKAKNMGVDPIWLISNYKCRSCGGVVRKA